MGPNGQPQNPLSYAASFVSRVVKSGRYTTGKIELSANSSTFLNLSCTLQIMVEHTGLLRWLFTIVWGKKVLHDGNAARRISPVVGGLSDGETG